MHPAPVRGASRAFSLRGAGGGGRYDAGPERTRITDGTSGSRGTEGDKTPARRADGPSACPGGSPSEPGGVSTKATIPGDMQQAAKSIACGTQAKYLLPWPSREPLAFSDSLDRVTRKGTHAVYGQGTRLPRVIAWRRGRGETLKRSARPFGGNGQGRTGKPWGRSEHGAMTRVRTPSFRGAP